MKKIQRVVFRNCHKESFFEKYLHNRMLNSTHLWTQNALKNFVILTLVVHLEISTLLRNITQKIRYCLIYHLYSI